VPGGAKIPGVVAENVVFARPRLAQGANAFGAEAGIEFPLVGIETGSEAHQRGRKQAAEQDDRDDRARCRAIFQNSVSAVPFSI